MGPTRLISRAKTAKRDGMSDEPKKRLDEKTHKWVIWGLVLFMLVATRVTDFWLRDHSFWLRLICVLVVGFSIYGGARFVARLYGVQLEMPDSVPRDPVTGRRLPRNEPPR
jgi:hypothetical protein